MAAYSENQSPHAMSSKMCRGGFICLWFAITTSAMGHPGSDGDVLYDHNLGWSAGFVHVDAPGPVFSSHQKLVEHFGEEVNDFLIARALEEENGIAAGNVLTVNSGVLNPDQATRLQFARKLATQERKKVWGDRLYLSLLQTFEKYGEPSDISMVRQIRNRRTMTEDPKDLAKVGRDAEQSINDRAGKNIIHSKNERRYTPAAPALHEPARSWDVLKLSIAGILLVSSCFLRLRRPR